ncbi:hypothetical protein BON30_05965 [Cystobacter ferrugineus]|uniref:Uncharacterized protein n=1 Tax=Cystobacter ferrugineus TaxID=83449 RepID=A0A1L9BKF5_9BACT|nr:hypothetical protein BON30_05965 [Cystobacter ferrugineus]
MVSELSNLRMGLGGSCTWSWKAVNLLISSSVGIETRPSSPSYATMKFLNDMSSASALTP